MSTLNTEGHPPAAVYRVFRLPPSRANALDLLLKDDLVGRQSIVSRDARSLGVAGEGTLVLVEGSDAGVGRAEALLKDIATVLPVSEAETAYGRFRSQDDDAASGMGLIFGV